MKPDVRVQNPADNSWFKSSYSSNEGGECIEVAPIEEAVLVRDSKDTSLPHLTLTRAGWTHFVRYAAGS
ncbi:DUF397 domain-containing protein [Streptomyces sp. NBC_01618]|uniref:DUF397 domain-containing protein n=1 Tax=Streptomyces sp. NBC_01618 TaxID=2975900 RepID=UPI00386D7CC5|nr:DUF397 domain-containing protein [Streptomyces sp. NBC_01618]